MTGRSVPPQRVAVVMAALALAACGSTAAGQRLPDASGQPPLSQSPVPAPSGLVGSGQLTVAIVPSLPVQQYLDHNQKPAGFDIDLVNAIGSQLALKVGFVTARSEDEVVPGLAEQKRAYDMGIADQVASAPLQSSARTVEYFNTGQSMLTAETDRTTSGLNSLCGKKAAALKSSQGEVEILKQNQRGCSTANRIDYQAYDEGSKAVQDVIDGKLTAYVDEYPTAVYFARVYGRLRVVPGKISSSREVMVFSIGDAPLRDAVATALDRLMKDGTYARLLKKWNLDEGAVASPLASPSPGASASPEGLSPPPASPSPRPRTSPSR